MTGKLKSPSGLSSKFKQRDAAVAIGDAAHNNAAHGNVAHGHTALGNTALGENGIAEKKVARRGRPPLGDRAKGVVTIRLDADVLESYRGLGAGWQTRINADLRRARKLKKARPPSEA